MSRYVKITCDCGRIISKTNLSHHLKTKIHTSMLLLNKCIIIDDEEDSETDDEEDSETEDEDEDEDETDEEDEDEDEDETDEEDEDEDEEKKSVNWANLPDDTIGVISEYISEEKKTDILVWKYGNICKVIKDKITNTTHLALLLNKFSYDWKFSRLCTIKNVKPKYIKDIFGELFISRWFGQRGDIQNRIYCIDLLLKKHYNTSLRKENTTSNRKYKDLILWDEENAKVLERRRIEGIRTKYRCLIYNPIQFDNLHQLNIIDARRTNLMAQITIQIPIT